MKMVLRDPRGIKPYAFGMPDLLCRQAISLRWRRVLEEPRKKAKSLQKAKSLRICQTLHEDLRTGMRASKREARPPTLAQRTARAK
jgi:hypothetical protein